MKEISSASLQLTAKIHFETVDVMRVRNGKITDHWGVGNLFSLMQQLGVLNF